MDERMYVGVDYHRKYSYLTVMNESGKIVREGKVDSRKDAVEEFLPKPTATAIPKQCWKQLEIGRSCTIGWKRW